MRRVLILACLLTPYLADAATAADPPATGTIAGVVRYTGKVPPPARILTTDGTPLLHSDLVVDEATKGLLHVVAVLEDAKPQPKVEKRKPAFMDQKDMLFVPRVVAVQHGQAVVFGNSDLFNHSVQAASTVPENQFNVFVTPGQPVSHVFAPQAAPVPIGCALHAWMRAWVYVVPHPWFAVSDARGRFAVAGVPPGAYTLWLRHADTGTAHRRRVTVRAGETTEIDLDWAAVGEKKAAGRAGR